MFSPSWIWNEAVRPIIKYEIPGHIRNYVLKHSNNLKWQIWKQGQLYIAMECPGCGQILGKSVYEARRVFREYNPKVDTFCILCDSCKTLNIKVPIVDKKKSRFKRVKKH